MAGYHKAFLITLDECRACSADSCPGGIAASQGLNRAACHCTKLSRPSMEGMGIDVFTTVRKAGFEINVLTDVHDTMNRFAMLLVV